MEIIIDSTINNVFENNTEITCMCVWDEWGCSCYGDCGNCQDCCDN